MVSRLTKTFKTLIFRRLPVRTYQKPLRKGFLNFTSGRPRHHLDISEPGYNVMYNDVEMVWLSDPFPYLEGHHDIYFTGDMAVVKPLNHSLGLPQPGKKGRTYILR